MKTLKILAVDISNVFWTIALAGSVASGNAARDWSLRDIREMSKGYDRVVVAVDGDERDPDWPQPSWRTRIWPKYKAGRKDRPAHLWPLLADTIRHCEAEGWTVLRGVAIEYAGDAETHGDLFAEADDVIGTLCAWAGPLGHEVDIMSGDSDLSQLVTDSPPAVRQIRRDSKTRERIIMNAAAVLGWEKLGVRPEHVADLKALAGDSGDGYGDLFPGIGDKTARDMLSRADWSAVSVATKAVQHVHDREVEQKSPNRHCKIIQEHGGAERAALGLTLARVRTDLSLDFARVLGPPSPTAPPSLPEAGSAELSAEAEAELEEVERAVAENRRRVEVDASAAMVVMKSEPLRMLMSPKEMMCRDKEIRALIEYALKQGPPDGVSDYGRIPGCGVKPALYDVGAERLCKIFGIYPKYKILKEIEALEADRPAVFYRVRCRLYRVGLDHQVGEQISSANSLEKTFAEQRSKTIFDLMNPVLNRAEKRAFVRAVLRATGAQKYLASGFDDLVEADFGTAAETRQWEQK